MVALTGLLFGFHLMLAKRYGMTPSAKEKPRVPAFYTKEEQQKFNPWWPRDFVYMLSLVLMTWGVILIVHNVLANINVETILGHNITLPLVINPYPAPQAFTTAAEHTAPYPPWFFIFLYKFVDFLLPNGLPLLPSMVIAVLIIGLVVLMLIPFFENSELMFISSRKFWTWVMSVLAYSLVALSIWGYLEPGVPAPFIQQVEIIGIPALILAIIIYLIPSKREKANATRPLGPLSILGTSVSVLLFAGTLGDFLIYPSLLGLLMLLPLGVVVYHYVIRMVRLINSANLGGGYSLSKKAAFIGITAIFVITISLFALLTRIPSVGLQSTYAGIDLGVILFLYLVYVKE
jgi:hypothetical protein